MSTPLSYGDYLKLDELLGCQEPESVRQGRPAHDEMLFIVVHQAYELWFKQILVELDEIQRLFAREPIDERDVGRIVHALTRIWEIWKLLIRQLDVLETMTPLDFLEFRDLLVPASGFQSLQFRLIEVRLGLGRERRASQYAHSFDRQLAPADRDRLRRAEAEPALLARLEAWLERMPFLDIGGYRFHQVYREAVLDMLRRDLRQVEESASLPEPAREESRAALLGALERFKGVLDEAEYQRDRDRGAWTLSWRALQAALFIVLYRDEPILQLPFRLLSKLMDVDETMTAWRHRHALMVQRMIGVRIGTGGSAGHEYLRKTTEEHRVFADLFALSSFLIPRSALPPLPDDVRRQMDFAYGTGGKE
jgi:tryptophan 2,3-dioxygenase